MYMRNCSAEAVLACKEDKPTTGDFKETEMCRCTGDLCNGSVHVAASVPAAAFSAVLVAAVAAKFHF